MKIQTNALTVLLITLLTFLCSDVQSQETVAKERIKYKFGAILTLSGTFASAGEDCKKGIEAALDISGKRDLLEVVYSDSKNDPSSAISEFRRLSSIENLIAVYTHRGTIALPLNPISKSLKIPMIGAVGPKAFAAGSEYSYQAWATSDEDGQTLAEQLIKLKLKSVAIVSSEDEWTDAVTAAFIKRFQELGGLVVFNQSVQPAESDFRSLLLRLKQKPAEAVFFNVLLPQIGIIVRQSRQLAVPGEYFSNFYSSKKEVIEAAGPEAIAGVRYLDIDTNLPTLSKALRLGSNESPAALTVASYVATMMIIQALPETGSINGPEEFNKFLHKQNAISTPDQNYKIIDRYIHFPLIVKTVSEKP